MFLGRRNKSSKLKGPKEDDDNVITRIIPKTKSNNSRDQKINDQDENDTNSANGRMQKTIRPNAMTNDDTLKAVASTSSSPKTTESLSIMIHQKQKWWKLLWLSNKNIIKKTKASSNILATNSPQSCLANKRHEVSPEKIPVDNTDTISEEETKRTNGDGNDKDDSYSCSSSSSEEESLLDLQSLEEEDDNHWQKQTTLYSKLKGIERLEKKLENRRSQLKRLSEGRSSSYLKMLEANDVAAREITIASYKQRRANVNSKHYNDRTEQDNSGKDDEKRIDPYTESHTTDVDDTTSFETIESNKPRPSIADRSFWAVLFELNHTLPCFYTVVVVLMGHTTFYCALEVILKMVYYNSCHYFMTLGQYHFLQTLLGLCLIRLNGNIFYWSSYKDYNLVRLQMRNRLVLGSLDARILKHIKGSVFSSALNMFGYYLASIGIFYFYYEYHTLFMDLFETWYTRIWEKAGFPASTAFEENNTSRPCEKVIEQVPSRISKWMVHYLCTDLTQEWRLVSIIYHGVWLLLVSFISAKLGYNLLTYCD